MKGRTAWAGAVMAGVMAAAVPAAAIEFSADYVTRINGKVRRAQIYVKGDQIRLEHQSGLLTDLGYAGVSIVRLDKHVVWLLLAQRHQYLTVALRKDHVPLLAETMEGETARTALREETLGKHRAMLYDVTVGTAPREEKYYQWVSLEHRLPLRTLSRDRDWAVEFEHVVFSKQEDFYFEVPHKYSEWKALPSAKPPAEAY